MKCGNSGQFHEYESFEDIDLMNGIGHTGQYAMDNA